MPTKTYQTSKGEKFFIPVNNCGDSLYEYSQYRGMVSNVHKQRAFLSEEDVQLMRENDTYLHDGPHVVCYTDKVRAEEISKSENLGLALEKEKVIFYNGYTLN